MAENPDDVDGGARRLVKEYGHAAARQLMAPEQRSWADIAAEVLGDEEGKIGVSYAGFALTGLPHKKLPNDQAWEKRGYKVRLLVEPGRIDASKNGYVGVPYGARARMILLYLQTQAIRTGCREVELGRNMYDWLSRMGLTWGGETGKALREQAQRIATCRLRFAWEGDSADGWMQGGFVRAGFRFHTPREDEDRQAALWEDRVVLDEVFYDALRKHPVPLRETALRELADRSLSLDLYIWMAYRMHTLREPVFVRWQGLMDQFGSGYSDIRNFRKRFASALAPAVAAYPEAKVSLEEKGLMLHPSPPPIARLVT